MADYTFPFTLPFILDGATGTELTKRGMPEGMGTEQFVLEHPAVLTGLQTEYIEAGADAVLAPTFGANGPNMLRHGFKEEEIDPVCRKLYGIARENAGSAKVAGDMSPTGLLLKPYGDADPESVFEIYRRQAETLLDCGADFFMIETMISAAEARLAVAAVRSLSEDIPIFVSLTVMESGRTVNGDNMDAVLLTMLPYSVQAFGCNCSIGPDVVAKALKPAAPFAKLYGLPLIAKPNAGMPVMDKDGTHFPLTPADMANSVDELTGLGVGVFGGCCGTTPAHVAAIAQAARTTEKKQRGADVNAAEDAVYVATARVWAAVEANAEYISVGPDSEDDLYDLMDEVDPEDVLYLDLQAGVADLLIRMDAYIPNPICVRGNEADIAKIEKLLCRKVR